MCDFVIVLGSKIWIQPPPPLPGSIFNKQWRGPSVGSIMGPFKSVRKSHIYTFVITIKGLYLRNGPLYFLVNFYNFIHFFLYVLWWRKRNSAFHSCGFFVWKMWFIKMDYFLVPHRIRRSGFGPIGPQKTLCLPRGPHDWLTVTKSYIYTFLHIFTGFYLHDFFVATTTI